MQGACAHCGAPLDERQKMCIECGAATEPGPRRRFRNALPTAGLALFALIVTASAAYAVTTDITSKPDRGTHTATVAAVPPAPAPTTPAPAPSATPTTPAPAPKATATAPKPGTPAPAPAPKASSPAPSSTPSTTSSTQSSPPTRTHHSSGGSKKPHHSGTPSILAAGDQPYQAALYDPYANGVDEHSGDAPLAVDGNTKTAWTTGSHPGGLNKPGVGLVVDTGGYQSYSAIGILTKTPGFAVSIYSTDQAAVPQGGPTAAGWQLEGSKSSVAKEQRISLKGASSQPQHFLVWITKLPSGRSSAGLSEISLLP